MVTVCPKALVSFRKFHIIGQFIQIGDLKTLIFQYISETCSICLCPIRFFGESVCRKCDSITCGACYFNCSQRFNFYPKICTGEMSCEYKKHLPEHLLLHVCGHCNVKFDCLTYYDETGLCKCEQTVNVCCCKECPQNGTTFLMFYCSEECERDANEPKTEDDEIF